MTEKAKDAGELVTEATTTLLESIGQVAAVSNDAEELRELSHAFALIMLAMRVGSGDVAGSLSRMLH